MTELNQKYGGREQVLKLQKQWSKSGVKAGPAHTHPPSLGGSSPSSWGRCGGGTWTL